MSEVKGCAVCKQGMSSSVYVDMCNDCGDEVSDVIEYCDTCGDAYDDTESSFSGMCEECGNSDAHDD